MATTFGPEPAPGASPLYTLGDHVADALGDVEATALPAEAHHTAPPPNPTFSFPARIDSPSSTPSFARSTTRRPMSAIETSNQSYQLAVERADRHNGRPTLPDFSFNPGATLPLDPHSMLSPPMSPDLPRMMPSGARPAGHGHRRGGSEFVGGQIRKGNSIAVLSGSPTKDEGDFMSPSLHPPRRGHRRGVSSTLSTNDLSFLPPPKDIFSLKGNSAPNSPTRFEHIPSIPTPAALAAPVPAPMPAPALDIPTPTLEEPPKTPELEPKEEEPRVDSPKVSTEEAKPSQDQEQTKPVTKARVGFSDTLEFIPRPLSMVSTDTSSTITAKPCHSVSGSITSFVTGPPPSGRESPANSSRSPTRETVDSRPSTAGAILERTPTAQAEESSMSPRRRNSIPALLDMAEAGSIPPTEPSPTKASKRWTFFGLDPFSSSGSPTKIRPHSASSADSTSRAVSGSSSDHGSSDTPSESTPKASKQNGGKKSKKRRKMVKGWADSILPRKPKNHSNKRSKYAVRPPTPPATVVPPDEDDEDVVMEVESPPLETPTVTITESPNPPPTEPSQPEEVSSPMIDLDAALGPFNTPLPNNPEWDAAQRAAGNNGRRRLHSAQGMRGFNGPGMHYHRRAESAPDLPPFDPGRAGMHRFGSSSTMADVFEEDEEDGDDCEDDSRYSQRGTSFSQSERDQDSDGDTTPPALAPPEFIKELAPSIRRKSSGLSDKDQSSLQSVRAQRSRTSLHENVIVEEPSPIRFRNVNVFAATAGSDASISPRASPRRVSGNKDLPPFELEPPQAPYAGTPVSPHSASFASSPRSPMSADTQRLSTAPSSVHEENSFQSLLLGEPGPEVRLSVDYDIPSLTSSNSTMTRDSHLPPQARMSQPTLREPRPLSVSSAAFGRRRSSLASLSRLISSSHGERSKLSMEVTAENEADNKKSRGSKTKRLGRLVQFWKPSKDETTS